MDATHLLLAAIIVLQLISLGVARMNADEIKALLDKLQTDIAARLQSLKDQIAALTAGQPITQAQLDALGAEIQGIDDSLNA